MFSPYDPFPQPSGAAEGSTASPLEIAATTSWGDKFLLTARVVTWAFAGFMLISSLTAMIAYLLLTQPELRSGEDMMAFLFAVALNVFLSFGLTAMSFFGYPALFQRRSKVFADNQSLRLQAWGFLGAPIRKTIDFTQPFSAKAVKIGHGEALSVTAVEITQGDEHLLLCSDEHLENMSGISVVSRFSAPARMAWAQGVWIDKTTLRNVLLISKRFPQA